MTSTNTEKNGKIILLAITIVNIIVFFQGSKFGGLYLGGAAKQSLYQPYQLITSMFIHSGTSHIYYNLIGLWIWGLYLIRYTNVIKFILIYFLGGIGANLFCVYYYLINYPNNIIYSVGASGAIYAVMGAVIMIIIREGSRYRNRINSILFLMIMVVAPLFMKDSNINNIAHISGFIIGFIISGFLYKKEI